MKNTSALLALSLLFLVPACSNDSGSQSETGSPDGSDASGEETGEETGEEFGEIYFEPDHLTQVSITMDPDDWDELRHQTRSFVDILKGDCLAQPFSKVFTYFPATVTIDGETVENVGVRKKGFFGSLNDDKPSLKLKLDEYDEGKLLHGMTRFTFNNSNQDPSHLNTCMSYHVFREAGLVAPRCAFATIEVNGSPLGVFIHVDSIKKPFLKAQFGDDEGNLYEAQLSDFMEEWKGTFEKKTNKTEADYSDIDAAVTALAGEGKEAIAAAGEVFDLDYFLSFWVVESLVGHWDGYNGNLNNYYIYNDPTRERFVFLPWGPDATFWPSDNPFNEYKYPESVLAHGRLSELLYSDEDWRNDYVVRLKELLDSAFDEDFLLSEVDRIEALISPHLAAGSNGQQALTKFGWDVERVREFIVGRRAAVLANVADGPADWPWPHNPVPCFENAGEVHATFDTVWGSLKDDTLTGTAIYEEYQFDNETVATTAESVAGIETEGAAAGQAVVSLVAQLPDGTLDIIATVLSPDQVKSDVVYGYGEEVNGYRLRLSPPFTQGFEISGGLYWGTFRLTAAEKTDGAAIQGRVDSLIFPLF